PGAKMLVLGAKISFIGLRQGLKNIWRSRKVEPRIEVWKHIKIIL
ncbi:hypothetical protein L195_g061142, partial [Trifolium pratense]